MQKQVRNRYATSWNAKVHVIIRARRAHFALRNTQYTWYYSGGLLLYYSLVVVVKRVCARPGPRKAPEQSPNSGKHQLMYICGICLSCCGQDIA